MSLLNPGQSKTDPVSGVAGAIWTALFADADSNLNTGYTPTPPALSPSPGTLTAAQLKIRKNLGAAQGALAAAICSIFSVGTGTVPHGTNTVVILDSAVLTATTLVIPCIIGAPDATAFAPQAACLSDGHVTIWLNANPTSGGGVAVGYLAINK